MTSTIQYKAIARLFLIGLCVFGVIGCPRSSQTNDSQGFGVDDISITPKKNGYAIELSAAAVYDIMHRCAFTDEQIYFHGAALRDALKNYGAATINVVNNAEVGLQVNGDEVQGISLTYGYFIYDVKASRFKLGAAPKPQNFTH